MNRMRTCLVVMTLAAFVATILVALVATPEEGARATIGPEGDGLGFGVPCKYSKSGDFDPIKYPGDSPPSPSHMHDFFGVLPFNASSTNTSIRKDHSGQMCDFAGDRVGRDFSAYWTPTSLDTKALTSKAYYKPVPVDDPFPPGGNRPYPKDLKIISDNVLWDCAGNFNRENSGPATATPHDCPGTNPNIMAKVRFPDCLKRVSGLSTHETHVGVFSPASTGVCPDGYTKFLKLELHVIYESPNAARLQNFSSGGPGSYHADFMNGWDNVDDNVEFNRLISQCVEDGSGCGQDGE